MRTITLSFLFSVCILTANGQILSGKSLTEFFKSKSLESAQFILEKNKIMFSKQVANRYVFTSDETYYSNNQNMISPNTAQVVTDVEQKKINFSFGTVSQTQYQDITTYLLSNGYTKIRSFQGTTTPDMPESLVSVYRHLNGTIIYSEVYIGGTDVKKHRRYRFYTEN